MSFLTLRTDFIKVDVIWPHVIMHAQMIMGNSVTVPLHGFAHPQSEYYQLLESKKYDFWLSSNGIKSLRRIRQAILDLIQSGIIVDQLH